MDMWTDLNLSAEWGLDLLVQPNGLFGDHKEVSRLEGDMDPARKPRDAVELPNSPVSQEPLDYDWMETGDLGSFLDALDNGQDKMLPPGDSLFDCSQEFVLLKDNVSDIETKSLGPQFESFFPGLTPPDSPEQVTPVIKLDPETNGSLWTSSTLDITPVVSPQNIAVSSQDFTSGLEPTLVEYQIQDNYLEVVDSKPEVFEASDIFGLTFTTQDIENVLTQVNTVEQENVELSYSCSSDGGATTLSLSEASSPRPSIDSLIESSPELYKVIATPSSVSARFSPYGKVKGEHKTRGDAKSKSKKVKPSPEPIDEELIFMNPSNLGKKERKKLQNKNAAIRYRQKKKAEVEGIVDEVQGLEDRNTDLKSKVDDLQREVRYMKSLMEDIYKAKGLVK